MTQRQFPFDLTMVSKLITLYGTPLQLYDEYNMRLNAINFMETFRQYIPGFKQFFAVKALPNPNILKLLVDLGMGLDCSSMSELKLAEMVGVSGSDIMFTSNFTSDTDLEFKAIKEYCAELNVEAILCKHWAEGSSGVSDLAKKVVQIAESGSAQFRTLYDDSVSLWEKTNTIAKSIYGAQEIIADKSVREQFKQLQESGYGKFPICMAKTQYSFSTDPNLKGAPTGHVVPIKEIRLSAGAEFLVVVAGEIMTMPGLPKVPAANSIQLNNQNQIEGLF